MPNASVFFLLFFFNYIVIQVRANYGPGVINDPLSFIMWLVKLQENRIIVSLSFKKSCISSSFSAFQKSLSEIAQHHVARERDIML